MPVVEEPSIVVIPKAREVMSAGGVSVVVIDAAVIGIHYHNYVRLLERLATVKIGVILVELGRTYDDPIHNEMMECLVELIQTILTTTTHCGGVGGDCRRGCDNARKKELCYLG